MRARSSPESPRLYPSGRIAYPPGPARWTDCSDSVRVAGTRSTVRCAMPKLSQTQMLDLVEKDFLKKDMPRLDVGDTVNVHFRIVEGDKERTQVFQGVLISHTGRGINEMMTVRRIVDEVGIERCFPVSSPLVATADFGYVRFHSSTRLHSSSYSDGELAAWAEKLTRLAAGLQAVYIYFNNDVSAFAVRNALTLRGLLGEPP